MGQVERKRNRRKNSLVVHGKRRVGVLVVCKGTERHELSSVGRHINIFQAVWIFLVVRRDFENHMVLVQTFVNCRDLPLAESVAERIVNVLDRNAKAAGRVAVNGQIRLQALVLLV